MPSLFQFQQKWFAHGNWTENAELPPDIVYHVRNQPKIFVVFQIIAAVASVTCMCLGIIQVVKFRRVGQRVRALRGSVFLPVRTELMLSMAVFPGCICFSQLLGLVFIRQARLVLLLSDLYTSTVLSRFWSFIVGLFGGAEKVAALAAAKKPYRIYVAAPLCCVGALFSKRQFAAKDLRYSRLAVWQFTFLAPIASLVRAFNNGVVNVEQLLNYVTAVSMFVCMWGLHVLTRALSPRLRNTVGIRVVVESTVIGTRLLTVIVGIPGVVPGYNEVYTEPVMVMAVTNFCVCVLSFSMAVLSFFVFSAQKLHMAEIKTLEKLRSSPVAFSNLQPSSGHSSLSGLQSLAKHSSLNTEQGLKEKSHEDDRLNTTSVEYGQGNDETTADTSHSDHDTQAESKSVFTLNDATLLGGFCSVCMHDSRGAYVRSLLSALEAHMNPNGVAVNVAASTPCADTFTSASLGASLYQFVNGNGSTLLSGCDGDDSGADVEKTCKILENAAASSIVKGSCNCVDAGPSSVAISVHTLQQEPLDTVIHTGEKYVPIPVPDDTNSNIFTGGWVTERQNSNTLPSVSQQSLLTTSTPTARQQPLALTACNPNVKVVQLEAAHNSIPYRALNDNCLIHCNSSTAAAATSVHQQYACTSPLQLSSGTTVGCSKKKGIGAVDIQLNATHDFLDASTPLPSASRDWRGDANTHKHSDAVLNSKLSGTSKILAGIRNCTAGYAITSTGYDTTHRQYQPAVPACCCHENNATLGQCVVGSGMNTRVTAEAVVYDDMLVNVDPAFTGETVSGGHWLVEKLRSRLLNRNNRFSRMFNRSSSNSDAVSQQLSVILPNDENPKCTTTNAARDEVSANTETKNKRSTAASHPERPTSSTGDQYQTVVHERVNRHILPMHQYVSPAVPDSHSHSMQNKSSMCSRKVNVGSSPEDKECKRNVGRHLHLNYSKADVERSNRSSMRPAHTDNDKLRSDVTRRSHNRNASTTRSSSVGGYGHKPKPTADATKDDVSRDDRQYPRKPKRSMKDLLNHNLPCDAQDSNEVKAQTIRRFGSQKLTHSRAVSHRLKRTPTTPSGVRSDRPLNAHTDADDVLRGRRSTKLNNVSATTRPNNKNEALQPQPTPSAPFNAPMPAGNTQAQTTTRRSPDAASSKSTSHTVPAQCVQLASRKHH
eukprot:Lankesteria_metandrocarpae@DN982_c0_g1_i1.p1